MVDTKNVFPLLKYSSCYNRLKNIYTQYICPKTNNVCDDELYGSKENCNINSDITDCNAVHKKNTSGLFSINGVRYYSESSVIHKPVKCCKCGFIPVEYIIGGLFYPKYYCSNCKKQ